MGIGGISTGRDAIVMMIAGASAVQVGCANLVDPYACPRIIQEMNDELDAMGIEISLILSENPININKEC